LIVPKHGGAAPPALAIARQLFPALPRWATLLPRLPALFSGALLHPGLPKVPAAAAEAESLLLLTARLKLVP